MNSLIQDIENNIETAIGSFCKNIAAKYNLDLDELMIIWNIPKELTKTNPTVKKTKSSVLTVADDDLADISSCQYLFTKGKQEGEPCGSKTKDGCKFCPKHAKYEGLEQKTKKVIPTTKKASSEAKSTDPLKNSSPVKKSISKMLRKNKDINHLWHSDTGMVFKSKDQLIVIGKCVKNSIYPLTDKDIDICMAHGFIYQDIVKDDNNLDKVVDKAPVKVIVDKIVEKAPIKVVVDKIVEKSPIKVVVDKVVDKAPVKVVDKVVDKAEKEENEIARKITAVPDNFNKQIIANAKNVKKSISSSLNSIPNVEDILLELQKSSSYTQDDSSSEIDDSSFFSDDSDREFFEQE